MSTLLSLLAIYCFLITSCQNIIINYYKISFTLQRGDYFEKHMKHKLILHLQLVFDALNVKKGRFQEILILPIKFSITMQMNYHSNIMFPYLALCIMPIYMMITGWLRLMVSGHRCTKHKWHIKLLRFHPGSMLCDLFTDHGFIFSVYVYTQ